MDTALDRIKLIQQYNEVLGISQINEKETLNFLITNQIKNMVILVDDEKEAQIAFERYYRFEMVLDNLQVKDEINLKGFRI